MISRKISSLILATATVAAFGGAALIPAISSAQTSCTFTRSLTVGSRGADVQCLQDVLKAGGFLNIASTTTYFGAMTKAAVARWQASAGITPAVGFFGPLSRAKLAMNGPVVVNPNPNNPNPAPVPMSGVMVSLASNQPMGSAIAGAGQLDVAKFIFTASNAAGTTITSMKFIRTGVVSDSNISNLYLADESGVIFAQYSSLNNGVAMFDGVNLQVNAGQSRVVTLRMDLSSSASAGNTLGWQLAMATASNGTVSGTPVTGPSLVVTTVSNPSLATATYTYVATGSTVDAGTNGFRTHSATVNVTNSAVMLKSIKYTVVGSADMVNLKNATLKISGVTVAMTPSIMSNGMVVFIPTGDVRIPTGNSTFEVYVDVAGSPNRTMAWNILRPYDAVFVDTQYNTPVTPTLSGSATTVTINQGRVTISKATDTPTANIPLGASNVTLAKFNFYAGGEPVKLRFLPITITRSGSVSTASTVDIRNISVVDDVGNSVGTTISSGDTWASSVITANFGTSSSYINYIIPANTTRVLSVKVDVQSDATASTLAAALATPSAANLEGQISFQTSTSGTASGNTLTIASSPLTAALNPSFASPTYVAGANNMRLGSFIFTASSAEGAKISSLTFNKDSNANFDVQNLRVMVGGTQFGTATSIVATEETSLSFSGSNPLIVPAGGSIVVDLYGDILTTSTSATHSTVFDLSGTSAVGSGSNSSITVKAGGVAISTTEVAGQSIVISSGSTVTLTTDSNNVSAKQVVMGSGSNVLYMLKLAANNTEDVRVTDITFRDTIGGSNTAGIASFNNLQLFDDAGTLLAGPVNMTISSATTGDVVFSLGSTSSLIVPKNSSKTITLKGDVATFISGGASSSSSHVFGISATSSVTAYGKDSSAAATISGTTTGSAQVVYRSKPTLTSSVLGSTTGRTRVAVDDIATLNWAANAADDLTISTVSVKFSGQAASNGSTAFTADLIDANTNAAWGSATQQTCTPGAGNSCSVSFGPAFSITRGSTKAVKLRVNSSAFFNGSNTSDSLSAIINAASDILWSDGTSTGISWEAVQIPITLVNLSYE